MAQREESTPSETRPRSATARVVAATVFAAVFSLGVYLLLQAARPEDGVVSFAFLLVLPAAVTAFVCWFGDPRGERRFRWYAGVASLLTAAVLVGAVFVLREGAICVVMLFPLWFVSALLGAAACRAFRPKRSSQAEVFSSSLLLLPLAVMAVEPSIPLSVSEIPVSRSIVVAVSAERLFPMLRGFPDIRPDEGRWTLTHDVLGVPRPMGARMVGSGVGADRLASWGPHVRFREHVTAWEPGRRLGWRFIFDDLAGWEFTDRHMRPGSPYFRVLAGEYRLQPLGPRRTRLTLQTRYRVRTPVNLYARLWGEVFLGDVQTNVLGLVKDRAEAAG